MIQLILGNLDLLLIIITVLLFFAMAYILFRLWVKRKRVKRRRRRRPNFSEIKLPPSMLNLPEYMLVDERQRQIMLRKSRYANARYMGEAQESYYGEELYTEEELMMQQQERNSNYQNIYDTNEELYARPEEMYEDEPVTRNAARINEVIPEEPVYEDLSYTEPVYEEPLYEKPLYEEPVYEQAGSGQPAYEQPFYEQTVDSELDLFEHAYDNTEEEISVPELEQINAYGEDLSGQQMNVEQYKEAEPLFELEEFDFSNMQIPVYGEDQGEEENYKFYNESSQDYVKAPVSCDMRDDSYDDFDFQVISLD